MWIETKKGNDILVGYAPVIFLPQVVVFLDYK